MKHDLSRWEFEIPLEDIATSSHDDTAANSCICCNKPIKNLRWYVHLLTNGNLVSSDRDFNEVDQGFFPIGNSCKNKLPNNFSFEL